MTTKTATATSASSVTDTVTTATTNTGIASVPLLREQLEQQPVERHPEIFEKFLNALQSATSTDTITKPNQPAGTARNAK
ncbi:MAG: hypothetical protein LBC43_03640 [Bifidobacteriaceae bacterium]|jgi:hypothetical protein|nr:hypothetical protein [Bifidobacteriaceae bacterium]